MKTIDLYKFINSKDIREYLKESKYEFKPLETIFIINQSFLPFSEKLEGIKFLIDSTEDFMFKPKNIKLEEISFHNFLKKYINVFEKQINIFANEGIFTFKICYENGDNYADDRLFSNSQDCLFNVKQNISDDAEYYSSDVQCITIKRLILDTDKYQIMYYNKEFDMLDFESCGLISDDDFEILEEVSNHWFQIPTPFKKGDILIEKDSPIYVPGKKYPVVLDFLNTYTKKELIENGFQDELRYYDERIERLKQFGDYSDMDVVGFFLTDDFCIYHEVCHNYLNLEKYNGSYENEYRLIKVMSLYLKNEIDLESLIKLNETIKLEEIIKQKKGCINISQDLFDTLFIK